MNRIWSRPWTLALCALPLIAALLLAADASAPTAPVPSWKNKPIPQWTEEESKQVLVDSPWVKWSEPVWLRDLSVEERIESGDWQATEGHGVGFEALLGLMGGSKRAEEAIARAHAKPKPGTVMIRWESARPVRASEQKVGEKGSPMIDADHYAVVIYDIPTPKKYNQAAELKDVAYLQRDKTNKKIKPSQVVIDRHEDGTATLTYLFPRSLEISKRDMNLVFAAQVGRLFVSLFFYPGQMTVRDELEL
jgi:hypothetical protein